MDSVKKNFEQIARKPPPATGSRAQGEKRKFGLTMAGWLPAETVNGASRKPSPIT